MQIEILKAEDRLAAQQFYTQQAYTALIQEEDIALIAKEGNTIVGLLRIALEENQEVLRGMFVDEHHQGKGIGKELLIVLSKYFRNEEAYCLPYRHLESFYGTIGFERIRESEAPVFLQERLSGYLTNGMDCIIMKRKNSKKQGGIL